ncbi:PepSY-associated TM helix domain-containing protein [Aquimarina aquimarini]|uniref:PepSY-associated TM helix domain-containing protein n=1 Tax=Aquimarina aquimarini TaxID=1191734 RepID=UPI001F2FFEF3|nr:PepSY-associated TM helix domain-containing protein [Aquimarina aquimarini]
MSSQKSNSNTYLIFDIKTSEGFERVYNKYSASLFGYYLAGFVSFFFLFAIVTGVIVHWKKIISNFYVFRPWAKLKTVWADAHTTLGVIGLPFQFMYALTGAMFCLYILTKQPLEALFPENQTEKISVEIVDTNSNYTSSKHINKAPLITPFLDSLQTSWKGFSSNYLEVNNYGNYNSTITVYGTLKEKKQFFHNAEISYDFTTKKITSITDPNDLGYSKAVYEVAGNLHHAKFGELGTWPNYLLKIIYFIMTMITCFVIITGVLIWLTARDKKNVPEKQKKFNAQVGYIYMAFCLTMFPATALAFIASKLIPEPFNQERKLILYCVFFGGWFVLSIFFWMKKTIILPTNTPYYQGEFWD